MFYRNAGRTSYQNDGPKNESDLLAYDDDGNELPNMTDEQENELLSLSQDEEAKTGLETDNDPQQVLLGNPFMGVQPSITHEEFMEALAEVRQ